MKYLLTIVYLGFSIGGMFLLKAGGDSVCLSFTKGLEFKIGYITLVGFICYVISFLLWQKLLIAYDLSYIAPITTGISQVIILIIGVMIFKEQFNWMSIVGVMSIVCGVVLIAAGKK
jgi:Membrane transporters of cations and cationic drugs